MPNLPEESTWHAGIRQLETTDPVKGGTPNFTPGEEDGHSNMAIKQLADRTAWLKANTPELAPANANFRIKNGTAFQLFDPETGLWHDVFIYTNNGTQAATLKIADVGEA